MADASLLLAPALAKEGRAAWEHFNSEAVEAGLSLSAVDSDLTQHVFALSPFVAQTCIRHPLMAVEMLSSGDLKRAYPLEAFGLRLAALLAEAPEAAIGQEAWLAWLQKHLRRFRRREMVRIAFRDLAGLSDYHDTVADLSALADACITIAVDRLHGLLASTYGQPGWPR